jgi:MinD superfamily P-loop ATPase
LKELVVLSGKGGTGKTSVAAAMAHLGQEDPGFVHIVLADADVDAANLELVFRPVPIRREDFWGGQIARIDAEACNNCEECVQICRFDAIRTHDGQLQIDPMSCEGCAACFYICPQGAISMQAQLAGAWFRADTRCGPLFHAALRPGEENSGRLVTLIKRHARQEAMAQDDTLLLIDGPPGISCPVISTISGADLALIVTEPSIAGFHDLRRVLDTARHFRVPAAVCINKVDLSEEWAVAIEAECRAQGLEILGRIPYDEAVTRGMVAGQPVTAFAPHSPASQALRLIWQRIHSLLWEKGA